MLPRNYKSSFTGIFFIQIIFAICTSYYLQYSSLPVKSIVATGFLAVELLVFPIAYYFFLIRRHNLRSLSLLLFFSISTLLAYFSLPLQQRQYIIELRKFTVLLELGIIIYFFTKIKQIRKEYILLQHSFVDTAYNIRSSIVNVMGDRLLFKLLGSEIIVLRYGIGLWVEEKQPYVNFKAFTSYKSSGYIAIWSVFVFVVLLETVGLHFLLLKWSTTAAVIGSCLSVYGLFFFLSDLNAVIRRPILVSSKTLFLRVGYRWKCEIQLENIQSIESVSRDTYDTSQIFMGAVIKSSTNVLIQFSKPVLVEKFFKQSIVVKSIVVNMDNRKEFIDYLEKSIDQVLIKS